MEAKHIFSGVKRKIKELNENQAQSVTETLFSSLSYQWLNIPDALKKDPVSALNACANKKIVQNHIISEFVCLVTLKDLTNLNRRSRNKKQFDEYISMLRNIYKYDLKYLP
ncbi:hypothetical protein ABEB36_003787, partial [Hypothenemus hampei]